jgi:hypothetical protein
MVEGVPPQALGVAELTCAQVQTGEPAQSPM